MKGMRFEARVLENTSLCAGVASLVFSAPEAMEEAVPGQFVHVLCGGDRILRRPVSLCGAGGGICRIVFELKGAGTRWLSERAAGDALDVLGPLGNGFDLGGRPLLAAGGMGAAPLLFAAKRAEGADAVLGFRSAERLMLLEEFREACGKVTVVSDDGSVGTREFADAAVGRALSDGRYDRVLACGPRAMLRAVSRVCAQLGVPCQVSVEERMGCGVGACLTCVCGTVGGYKRVCRDGPVFDAEEVLWDD